MKWGTSREITAHSCNFPASFLIDLNKFTAFIRGLLENVGAEIDPIRLIRRIKNGLEIPGLKPALIKILHDFNLQASLLEGCQTILNGDSSDLAQKLHMNQTQGFPLSGKSQLSASFIYLTFLRRRQAPVSYMLVISYRDLAVSSTTVLMPPCRTCKMC